MPSQSPMKAQSTKSGHKNEGLKGMKYDISGAN